MPACSYVAGKVKDLSAGIEMARQAVANGSALAKLRAWVAWQNAKPGERLQTLERMLERALLALT